MIVQNLGPLKHAVSSYEINRNYIDGLKGKQQVGKVKKTSFKNG